MTRRSVACVCVAVGLGSLLLWRMTASNPRLNRESYELLQDGMTEQEVIAIIGASPFEGKVTRESPVLRRAEGQGRWFQFTGIDYSIPPFGDMASSRTTTKERQWFGKDVAISIGFDADGCVVEKSMWHPFDRPESFFDRVIHAIRR